MFRNCIFGLERVDLLFPLKGGGHQIRVDFFGRRKP